MGHLSLGTTVDVVRNNHPRKIHLTAPPLASLTVGCTVLPVVRVVGDCGHFWDRCPPGALTCQLMIPPMDPPIRLPLFAQPWLTYSWIDFFKASLIMTNKAQRFRVVT